MSIFILTALLAGTIGFAAHRANFCSVGAVKEVLTTRRAFMLISFIKMVTWVVGSTLLITWIVPEHTQFPAGWALSFTPLVGGLVFGIGATINGGCAFSTLTRLGSGNFGMVISLMGFGLGAGVHSLVSPTISMAPSIQSSAILPMIVDWRAPVTIALTIWMVWEIFRVSRSTASGGLRKNVLASHYRLSTTALLMGLCNAVLYVLVGNWTYTNVLNQSAQGFVTDALSPSFAQWALVAALVVGAEYRLGKALGSNGCGALHGNGLPIVSVGY